MWFKKKVTNKILPTKMRYSIIITFYNNKCTDFWFENKDKNLSCYVIYREFYKWYVSRLDSEIFNFRFTNGSKILKRKDIFLVEFMKEEV